MPEMIEIRIFLANGHVYETSCAPTDPLIDCLAAILSPLRTTNASSFVHLTMQSNGKPRGVAILTEAIVAIETDPPLLFADRTPLAQVERAPYIRIPQFLTAEENRRVFDYAVQQQPNFVASKVVTGDSDYRRSMILPKFDDLEIDLEARLREILPELFTRFGMTAPQRPAFEKQLTTHNHGGYFKVHNDNGSPESATRLLTYIYYFHRDPPAFSGGQIRIYDFKGC